MTAPKTISLHPRAAWVCLLIVCVFGLLVNPAPALTIHEPLESGVIDVTKSGDGVVGDGLIPNDEREAEANTQRFHAILEKAGERARVHFPAGVDYRLEPIRKPGPLEGTTNIHWIGEQPSSGSVYYVTVKQDTP